MRSERSPSQWQCPVLRRRRGQRQGNVAPGTCRRRIRAWTEQVCAVRQVPGVGGGREEPSAGGWLWAGGPEPVA